MNKMIFLMYDSAIDVQIEKLLALLEVDGYTKWRSVDGYGGGQKRFGDKVWPGTNSMRMIVDDNDKTDRLIEKVKELRESFAKPPVLKLFKLPVEQVEL